MTPSKIKVLLKRMRRLYADGRLEEAARLAAVLLPFCHEKPAPIVVPIQN